MFLEKKRPATKMEKQDQILQNIGDINITLAKITIILENQSKDIEKHIKRTDLAEARVDKLERIIFYMTGAWYALGAVGVVILALDSMGILKRLFA